MHEGSALMIINGTQNILHPRLLSDCQCQSQFSYKRALPKNSVRSNVLLMALGVYFFRKSCKNCFHDELTKDEDAATIRNFSKSTFMKQKI